MVNNDPVSENRFERLPEDVEASPDNQAAATASPALDESKKNASVIMNGRTIGHSSGRVNQLAQAAVDSIKEILSGLSNAIMAVVNSPIALAKSIHSYMINSCMEEFSSRWDAANHFGTLATMPASKTGGDIHALNNQGRNAALAIATKNNNKLAITQALNALVLAGHRQTSVENDEWVLEIAAKLNNLHLFESWMAGGVKISDSLMLSAAAKWIGTDANFSAIDAKNGDTVLTYAAEKDLKHVADFMLKLGADVHSTNQYGNSPLTCALDSDKPHMAKVFLDHMAKKGRAENENKNDLKVLTAAAKLGHFEVLNVWMKAGVNVADAIVQTAAKARTGVSILDTNARGDTALSIATQGELSHLTEALRRLGAK